MNFKGYGATELGSREMNQDSFLVDNERGIFGVADGVGGGLRGEVASLMAVTGLGAHPEEGSTLAETFTTVQEAILSEAIESVGDALMGTTMTAVRMTDDWVELCHVGDSRCYLLSGGLLRMLTEDHEMFDEAFQGPVLNSYLGIDTRVYPLKIFEDTLAVSPGDKLLICSDGLYKQLSESRIAMFLSQPDEDFQAVLQSLVQEAAKNEYSDNVTAVVIEILP